MRICCFSIMAVAAFGFVGSLLNGIHNNVTFFGVIGLVFGTFIVLDYLFDFDRNKKQETEDGTTENK